MSSVDTKFCYNVSVLKMDNTRFTSIPHKMLIIKTYKLTHNDIAYSHIVQYENIENTNNADCQTYATC